jgi:regulatory protein
VASDTLSMTSTRIKMPRADMKSKRCLESALRLLTRRSHSRAELAQKLSARGFSETDIQTAVSECRRWGYLNEHEYALSLIRRLVRKGFGPAYLHQTMIAKKLPLDIIETAMQTAELDRNETDCCRYALSRKIKSLDIDADAMINRNRLYQYLFRRGFSPDVICRILEEFFTVQE